MEKIPKIRNMIPAVVGGASAVSRALDHWHHWGSMHAKHIVALGLGLIFSAATRNYMMGWNAGGLLKVLKYENAGQFDMPHDQEGDWRGENGQGRGVDDTGAVRTQNRVDDRDRQHICPILLRRGQGCDVGILATAGLGQKY